MRAGSGRELAGPVPHEVQTSVEKILYQSFRDQSGGDGLPVRADSALLGGGERAGLHVAVRQSDVQDRLLRDSHEHVRQRLLPHCHERGEVLVARLGAEGQKAAGALLLGALHHRLHLVRRRLRRAAARGLLHHRVRLQRGLVSRQIPRKQRERAALARALPLPEGAAGLRAAAGHHHSLLPAAAALHHLQKHQHVERKAARQSHQVRHHRGAVLLPLLAAQPGAHRLGHPHQTQRGELQLRVLHHAGVRVPRVRVPGALQQLPEPHPVLPDEAGVQEGAEEALLADDLADHPAVHSHHKAGDERAGSRPGARQRARGARRAVLPAGGCDVRPARPAAKQRLV